jgi:Ca2+-binding EF-hand superfamily protein
MKNMGYESSNETADSILREVDFGRKGYIEFGEYLDVSYLQPFTMTTNDRLPLD